MKTKKEIEKEIKDIEDESEELGFQKNGKWIFSINDSEARIKFTCVQTLRWVLSDTKKGKKK